MLLLLLPRPRSDRRGRRCGPGRRRLAERRGRPSRRGAALRGWWADHRWRYRDDEEARARLSRARRAPIALAGMASGRTSSRCPAGLRFQMALAPGQPTDRPGAFGTFDRIPDVAFVRPSLAVKLAWKPAIDRVGDLRDHRSAARRRRHGRTADRRAEPTAICPAAPRSSR